MAPAELPDDVEPRPAGGWSVNGFTVEINEWGQAEIEVDCSWLMLDADQLAFLAARAAEGPTRA